jgi:hypothetical protein
MEFEIGGLGSFDPGSLWQAGRERLSDAVTNATVTIGGLPEVRTPSSVTVGGGGVTSASSTDNGMLIIAAVAAVILFSRMK